MESRPYREKSPHERFRGLDYSRSHAEAFARRYDDGRRQIKIALVSKFIGECHDKDVLDIGCGIGFFSSLGVDMGARAVACDFSQAMIEKVGQRYGQKFPIVQASAEVPPFRDGSFDTVLALDMIEHLYKPEQMLANASRILRPRGRLIIVTDVKGPVLGSVNLRVRHFGRRLARTVNRYLSRTASHAHVPSIVPKLSATLAARLSNPYTTPLCTHTYEYRIQELQDVVRGAGFRLIDFDTFPNRASYGVTGNVLEFIARGPLKRYKWPHAIYEFRKPADSGAEGSGLALYQTS
jgi:2-polyprenyl-3-methyl-5-hydroxy-6-metoxy-1,4-benzoquinol methylase